MKTLPKSRQSSRKSSAPSKGRGMYSQFCLEREEILKLKWIESEKQGGDIGMERALFLWATKHRRAWLDGRERGLPNPFGAAGAGE